MSLFSIRQFDNPYQRVKSLLLRYFGSLIFFFSTVFLNLQAQVPDTLKLLMDQYDYQRAIDLMDKIDGHEEKQELLELKIAALMGMNLYQESLPYFQQLYLQDSTNVSRIVEFANCYQSLGNYQAAQKLYQKALEIYPQNNYVRQQLANSYFKLDDFTEAKNLYLFAYTRDSSFFLARQLGVCYDNLDLKDTAIYYYKISLAFNPFDFESTYRLANLHKQQEEYPMGIALTDNYLLRDSTNFKMLRLSGFLHFLNGSYDRSVKRFERCVVSGDTSDFVNKYLGYSYFRTGEFELAKDYLEKAFLKDTTNADLCYVLGLSCDYSIYKKLAIYYLNKTIELLTPSPEYMSHVYQDLAVANTGYSKFNDALDAYLAAYELTPNDTLLIFKIASHYDNRTDDKETALLYYQKFMDTRPRNKNALPKMPGMMVISYYDYVEKRMAEIREEMFWEEQ